MGVFLPLISKYNYIDLPILYIKKVESQVGFKVEGLIFNYLLTNIYLIVPSSRQRVSLLTLIRLFLRSLNPSSQSQSAV